jgi:hypothetical protein
MLSNGIRWECPGGYLGETAPQYTLQQMDCLPTQHPLFRAPPCLYQATSYCLIAIGSVSKSFSATAPHISPFPGLLFNPLSYGLFWLLIITWPGVQLDPYMKKTFEKVHKISLKRHKLSFDAEKLIRNK